MTDWECSLAGVCRGGACACDPWASGRDCSWLNLEPVDDIITNLGGRIDGRTEPLLKLWHTVLDPFTP